MVHGHANLSLSEVYRLFRIYFGNFSIINDYGGVGGVLIQLKVNPSGPKVRVLMIMQSLAFL